MTEEQVKAVFEQALEKPASDRDAYLDRVCGGHEAVRRRIETLLRAHDAAHDFLEPLEPATEGPGSVIGRYKLLQEIGQGGFGTVYMAEQTEPVRRKVALKIIKLGMDTKEVIARFEAERQALALLDHPNIAKVFDAGATGSGRPYFVMELVRGIPITEYCDQAKLSTGERLELFKQVCRAIQHTHLRGIIHRDIKPSNVMVTLADGIPLPKVIDFGIAKATNQRLTERTLFTQYEQIVGTPAYMSPEQAEMSALDVDTRADVYSLGVLLYELLTGSTPFDMNRLLESGYAEMLRVIREVDPQRPSTRVSSLGRKARAIALRRHATPNQLPKLLRGDLDWIVMRALEKDRTRRYETAGAMAADIDRLLEDRPVEASPPSAVYRARKFIKRNRTAVLTGVMVLTALVAGLALALYGLVEANQQRDVAVSAQEEAVEQRDKATDAQEQEAAARARAEQSATEAHRARGELATALQRSRGMRLFAESAAVRETHPSLSLLLAIEGAKAHPGSMANSALLAATDVAPEQEIILGGEEHLHNAVPSPDGRLVATGGGVGTVLLWETRKGGLFQTIEASDGHAFLAFSPDSARLLISSKRQVVWDIASRRQLFELKGHQADKQTWQPFWTPDGRRILTISSDGTARIWDAADGRPLHLLKGHQPNLQGIYKAGLSRDGKLFFTSEGHTIAVWEVESGKRLHPLFQPPALLRGIAFSPDNRYLVAATAASRIHVWDLETGKRAQLLENHELTSEGSMRVLFTPDGRRMVSTGADKWIIWDWKKWKEIRSLEPIHAILHAGAGWLGQDLVAPISPQDRVSVIDLETGETRYSVRGHQGRISGARVLPDGRLLSWGGESARIWKPHTGRQRTSIMGQKPNIFWFATSPDGKQIVSASARNEAWMWEPSCGRVRRKFKPQSGWVTWAEFDPRGKRVVTATGFGARLFDIASGQTLRIFRGHTNVVLSARFSPNGRLLLTGAGDCTVRLWRISDGKLLHTFGKPHRPKGYTLVYGWQGAFSPDGSRILAWFGEIKEARVYDLATRKLLHTFKETSVAHFSPDGRWIVTTRFAVPRNTRIYDARTFALRHTFDGTVNHPGPSPFSPDGKRLAIAVSAEVHLVDVESGKVVLVLTGHRTGYSKLAFSPDGKWIAGQGQDVRLWNAATGEERFVLAQSFSQWAPPLFTKDSKTLIVAESEGTIRMIPVDPLPVALRNKPREWTATERKRYEID